MSNSTTLLDQISSTQANKEAVANALFDAASPATLWGRHGSATSGLTWGYYGGTYTVGTTANAIANGTLTLTASATNYIYADPTTGAVSVNTTGFPSGKVPLYTVVTGTSTVTSYTDNRSYAPSATAAGAGVGIYDVGIYVEGTSSNSETVWDFVAPRGFTIPSGASGAAVAGVAATGSTTYTLAKTSGGVTTTIGTITWAASGTVGTVSITANTTFIAGDVLSLTAPSTADATLANIAVTLAGTRP
jgi:hypothetical protein